MVIFRTISVLLGAAVLVTCSQQDAVAQHWQAAAEGIQRDFGVIVVFDDVPFPEYWSAWRPEYRVVAESKRRELLRRLRIDLSRYEPNHIRQNLQQVMLVEDLSFRGQKYGGTNDHLQQWVYLHEAWVGDDGAHQKAMGFHHEFSSILLKRYRKDFPEAAWRRCNQPGFRYAFEDSTEENLRSGRTGLVGNTAGYRAGFLCDYGQLTFEDDVNTFAQLLIAKPGRLKILCSEHERIERKTQLLQQFLVVVGSVSDSNTTSSGKVD